MNSYPNYFLSILDYQGSSAKEKPEKLKSHSIQTSMKEIMSAKMEEN